MGRLTETDKGSQLQQSSTSDTETRSVANRLPDDLTDRQRELLLMVAQGKTSKQMAILTGLAVASIDNALSRAARILGARNRREAASILVAIVDQQRLQAVDNATADRLPSNNSHHMSEGSRTSKGKASASRSMLGALIGIISGPTVGGRAAPHGWRQLTLHVLWAAFVGILGVSALTLFILAFFQTFR